MRSVLSFGGMTAAVELSGGELVSLRDERGAEYIWQGEAPYWQGRNPILFPIVGKLRGDTVMSGEGPCRLTRHGFARGSRFTLLSRTDERIELELRESAATLAQYPYPFALRVAHELTGRGFTTTFSIENTGSAPMPFCIGSHTAFRCPLHGGSFEDHDIVFDGNERLSTLLLNEEGLLSPGDTRQIGRLPDRFALEYGVFAELDTLIFEGLSSSGVSLLHRESGRGVRLDFSGFPMLALWTEGAKRAPFICLEAWHGCTATAGESGRFEDKPHCVILPAGGAKQLSYTVSIL